MRHQQNLVWYGSVLIVAWLGSCGKAAPPSGALEIAPPGQIERDYGRNDEAALALEAGPLGALLLAAQHHDGNDLFGSLSASFRGRFPSIEQLRTVPDGTFSIADFVGDGVPHQDGHQFIQAWLSQMQGWTRIERAQLGLSRLQLSHPTEVLPIGVAQRATGQVHVELGAKLAEGGRASMQVDLAFEALKSNSKGWQLSQLDILGGHRLQNQGEPFRPIQAETGFSFHESERNRELGQSFIDDHLTLALGGLSALDWNQDGFWDLLATREGQLSTLFRNDGSGGFVPELLPVDSPNESASFLVSVDLDGDGSDELVSSKVLSYQGERAYCGLYTRSGGFWSLRSDALSFPNPRGLRRLAIQTMVPFDANGDGLLDLFFAVYGSAISRGPSYNSVEAHDGADNHLFINQGDLRFVEESDKRGITGTQFSYVAGAFDFDQDGDPDLFEGNDFGPNIVWLNDGAGNFTRDTELGIAGDSAFSMGVAVADFDNTGRWSLYVSNMHSDQGSRMIDLPAELSPQMRERVRIIASGNRLFEQQANGKWQENAAAAGCARAGWSWGSLVGDLDNDGDQDLVVANGFTSHSKLDLPDWQYLYWRQVLGDARSLELGQPTQDHVSSAGRFRGSFNGYERDRYFHNPDGAQGRFVEAGYVSGLDLVNDGRANVPVDVDGDGDLDIALWTLQGLVLLENRSPATNFTRIALQAPAGISATLGAMVEVTSGGVTQRQQQRLVEGFQTQVPSHLHFGLGEATTIDSIVVRWPSGASETWTDLPSGQLIELRQGDTAAQASPLPAWPEKSRPRGQAPSAETFAQRIGGGSEPLARLGAPTVIRLAGVEGAPWPDAERLRRGAPNLRMVLLLPGEELDRGIDESSFTSFALDRELSRQLFGSEGPVRPTTLIFDSEGKLARSFLREVETIEVLSVLAELAEEAPFPDLLIQAGRRSLREGRFRNARELFQAAVLGESNRTAALDGLARSHRMLSRPDLAEETYRRAIQTDPDYALGHYNLGSTLIARGAIPEAIEAYREALRIWPHDAKANLSLGEALLLNDEQDAALEAYALAAANIRQDEPLQRSVALTNRGKLLGHLERFDEALEALEQALVLDPLNTDAERARDLVLRLQGEQD